VSKQAWRFWQLIFITGILVNLKLHTTTNCPSGRSRIPRNHRRDDERDILRHYFIRRGTRQDRKGRDQASWPDQIV